MNGSSVSVAVVRLSVARCVEVVTVYGVHFCRSARRLTMVDRFAR